MADPLSRKQDPIVVREVLKGLEAGKGKNNKAGFQAKSSTFSVKGSQIKVNSWKINEWDYKKANLPTYARGLFTATNSQGNAEIVTRGYDKFFNNGEVKETEWDNIIKNTRGPYELSVKENGCIIFMSGLEDGTLLVCSKHSTGSRGDVDVSHAEWGAKWVDKHVESVGKTRKDLALALRAMNATAVAELCDDEFEEHVLEYSPDSAGLYLHGINLNLPDFATYPHSLVEHFAEQWGFRQTMYIVKDDIQEVKSFLEDVAETGHYDGRDTEGFVIRCQSNANTGEWHDWFFKYKFEEPYLMYRQWRECTKAIIAGKEPKYKKHKQITEEYLDFARRLLHGDKELAKQYNQNHGIIKMRDDFLKMRGTTGSDIIRDELKQNGAAAEESPSKDVMLVPVATLGCGKTTVALALVKLFGWGHVQNDNITVKKGKPAAFAHKCAEAMGESGVMIADRNNHQRRERTQLIEDVSKIVPWAKFVALHFRHDRQNVDAIRKVTRERVLTRGDNHQTIHVNTIGEKEIIGIMDGFLQRFEPVNADAPPDDDFDLIIDLDPLASTEDSVMTTINQLFARYPKLFPDELPGIEEVRNAIAAANSEYTVQVKHEIRGRPEPKQKPKHANVENNAQSKKKKEPQIEYFGVTIPATEVLTLLEGTFQTQPPEVAQMYNYLKDQKRIQAEFHVTIIHRSMASQHSKQWSQLQEVYNKLVSPDDQPLVGIDLAEVNVRLPKLVWNDRIMAFTAETMAPIPALAEVCKSANPVAHVTVGTANASIKPVESNDMLMRWLKGNKGYMQLDLDSIMFKGTLRAVMARQNGINGKA